MKPEDFKDPGRPVVLVVEDDPNTRLLVRETLAQSGFSITEACNGEEALECFRRTKPDIVLLDVIMPGMDGFSVCRRLRTMEGGINIPVVMMTSLDDLESINRAYEAGATDFITKPLNWPVLSHRLRYILRASRAFEDLKKSERRNRAFVKAIPDLMFRIRMDGTILDYAAAKKDALVVRPEDFLMKRLQDVLPELALEAMDYMERALETMEPQVFEYTLSPGGEMRYYEARVVVSGEDEVLTIVRDITERKRAEEHIRYLAYYDSLTGLPNRQFFKERLAQAIARAEGSNRGLAVLFLDLDRFKRINDTLGHTIGDELLKGVAGRLSNCFRKMDELHSAYTDRPGATVARLGGDEFIVLLSGLGRGTGEVEEAARRVLGEISAPFVLMGHEVFVTASMGITIYPSDGRNVDTLLKNADTAMYHAKDCGRNNYQFYRETMNESAFERLSLENSMRRALERGEFRLFYQPQIDITTGGMVGVEALVRWEHPLHGLVPPSEFIPLAEEAGLIIPIGRWVVQTACRQAKIWQLEGLPRCTVAVNISGRQFRDDGLIESIAGALREAELDPGYLKLELTESVLMQNVDDTVEKLMELKAMGTGLLIDDFGTGYSSLSYLKRFPIDALKIDRSFVKDIPSNPDDAVITRTIIAMAHSMNLKVIAEGVETPEQLSFLRANRCDEMQGHLFSRAVEAEAVSAILGGGTRFS